jgi:hypothetical protein
VAAGFDSYTGFSSVIALTELPIPSFESIPSPDVLVLFLVEFPSVELHDALARDGAILDSV